MIRSICRSMLPIALCSFRVTSKNRQSLAFEVVCRQPSELYQKHAGNAQINYFAATYQSQNQTSRQAAFGPLKNTLMLMLTWMLRYPGKSISIYKSENLLVMLGSKQQHQKKLCLNSKLQEFSRLIKTCLPVMKFYLHQ